LRLRDQSSFTAEVDTVGFDLLCLAQDAQGTVMGVQCAVHDRGGEALGIVLAEGVF